MKAIIPFIAMLFALNMARGQQTFAQAKQKALQENKLILLNFSGSDWCIPCIKMQKEVFENKDFITMADSQLVMVRADFPRKKKNMPSRDIVVQNEKLAEKFNPNGSFPLTLLIDPNEKIIKVWDGLPDATAASFTNSIQAYIKQYKKQ